MIASKNTEYNNKLIIYNYMYSQNLHMQAT